MDFEALASQAAANDARQRIRELEEENRALKRHLVTFEKIRDIVADAESGDRDTYADACEQILRLV